MPTRKRRSGNSDHHREIKSATAAHNEFDAVLVHLQARPDKLPDIYHKTKRASELFKSWVDNIKAGLHKADLPEQLTVTQFFVQRQALKATVEAISEFINRPEHKWFDRPKPATVVHTLLHCFLVDTCRIAAARLGIATSRQNTVPSIGAEAALSKAKEAAAEAFRELLGTDHNTKSLSQQEEVLQLGSITDMPAIRDNLAFVILSMVCPTLEVEGTDMDLRHRRANQLYIDLMSPWSIASGLLKRKCEQEMRKRMLLVREFPDLPDKEAYWASDAFLKLLVPNDREPTDQSSTRNAMPAPREEAEHSLLKPRMARRHLAHYFGVGTTQEDWQRARRSNRW